MKTTGGKERMPQTGGPKSSWVHGCLGKACRRQALQSMGGRTDGMGVGAMDSCYGAWVGEKGAGVRVTSDFSTFLLTCLVAGKL